jgi:hypothetical protein
LPEVSRELLLRTLEGKPPQRVAVTAQNNTFSYSFD